MKGKTYNEKLCEISAYINEFYGKPEENNLSNWLNENFDFIQK